MIDYAFGYVHDFVNKHPLLVIVALFLVTSLVDSLVWGVR